MPKDILQVGPLPWGRITAAWAGDILKSQGIFVIEHMGWPPVEKGLNSGSMQFLRSALETGRCWVKLSPRFSSEPVLPFSDVKPFVEALVARYPDRLLWGSDWPHPTTSRRCRTTPICST